MKKISILAIALFGFLYAGSTFASNTVQTLPADDIETRSAELKGATASSSPATETVTVYFEYGLSSSSLSSSTVPVTLSSGDLQDNNATRFFEEEVDDLVPNATTYFRIVRKVVPTSGSTSYYRGEILSFTTQVENIAPYISTFQSTNTEFETSNCSENGCTIEIPENLPRYTKIAQLERFDINGDLTTLVLKSGNTDGAFELEALGALKIANQTALDFERRTEFTLEVEAKDYGSPRLASIYPITVKLKDITNEAAPLPTSYTSEGGSGVTPYTYTFRSSGSRGVTYTSGSSGTIKPYTYSTGSTNTSNTTYVSGSASTYSGNQTQAGVSPLPFNPATLTADQKAAIIQSIIAQIAILRAELERRIQLGLE